MVCGSFPFPFFTNDMVELENISFENDQKSGRVTIVCQICRLGVFSFEKR